MSPTSLLFILLGLTACGYYAGRRRAFAVDGRSAGLKPLHSRPTYYGSLTALWCGIHALLLFGFWLAFESTIITNLVVADLPEAMRNLPAADLNLQVNSIRNLVSGNIVVGPDNPHRQAAAVRYRNLQATSNAALAVVAVSIAIFALVMVRAKISPSLRARNAVEQIIKYILIICSTIAIFTTVGIVLSLLFESIR